jgi:hypothetical protein
VRTATDAALESVSIDTEMGWPNADEPEWGPVSSVMLLSATSVYFISSWIVAGLQPLAMLVGGLPRRRGARRTPASSPIGAQSIRSFPQ